MSRLLLLDGCFAAFIFSKKGGSCHLGFGLRASPALVPYSSVPDKKNKKLRRDSWVAGFPL